MMYIKKRALLATVAILTAIGAATSANASVIYTLDLQSTPGTPAGPAPYATVTLDSTSVDGTPAVEFTIQSLVSGFKPFNFYFNARSTSDPTKTLKLIGIEASDDVNIDLEGPGQFTAGTFGKFDYFVQPYVRPEFTGDVSSYSFIVLAQKNHSDLASVISNYVFLSAGGNSTFFSLDLSSSGNTPVVGGGTPSGGGPPAPEPASLSLLGIGASALLLRRRKA